MPDSFFVAGLITFAMMQRLIARKNAVFGSPDLTSLQTDIPQELIVERAEMLLIR